MHEMQYHKSAPRHTAPTALPTPIPIFTCVSSPPASDEVEKSVGLKPTVVVVLDKFEGSIFVGVTVEAVISCVIITVLTTPLGLVVRDVEVVWEAVPVLVAVELGTAIDVVVDGDDACVAVEQYGVKLGKHDDWGYAVPSCIIFWMGESAAMKASVADVWGQLQPIPWVTVGALSPQANQFVETWLQVTRPTHEWSTLISIRVIGSMRDM
jgi:hypothetical protein